MEMGSLWVCDKPNWYLYKYTTSRLNGKRSNDYRYIKYTQQSIISAYQQEEALTPNHALFMTSFCAGIYEFAYNFETIRMRDEFIYKFVEDWARV